MESKRSIHLSVLVAAFNVEEWINDCLNSLKIQSLKEVEYIVVDDASTDKTGEICNRYAIDDSRFA